MYPSPKGSAFTLIELLVVIAIVAILSIVVVLTLSPAELLRQSRDATRISDLDTLNKSLALYITDLATQGGFLSLGNASTVYVSLIDTASSTCGSWSLPSLPAGYVYHCSSATSSRNTDTTGWIPVNLKTVTTGSPLGSLPQDPTNQSSTNLYYTYQTNGSQYELTTFFESGKYAKAMANGGIDPALYAVGSNTTLPPLGRGLVGYWPMDEGAGVTTMDVSGNGMSLTIMPSSSLVTWQPGETGSGLKYDSSVSSGCVNGQFGIYTNSLSPLIQNLPVGSFSVSLWQYYVGGSALFHFSGTYGAGGFNGLWVGQSGVSIANNVSTNTPFNYTHPPINGWHHYVYVFDAGGVRQSMYVDGSVAGSGSLSGTYGTFNNFDVGIYLPGCVDSSPGAIFDNVRIYNRALLSQEIQELYNAEK